MASSTPGPSRLDAVRRRCPGALLAFAQLGRRPRPAAGQARSPEADDPREEPPGARDVPGKLVLLFIAGALLINFPVFAIFNRALTVGGIPVLYLYLFGVWAAGIAAVFVLAHKRWDEED